MNIQRGGELNRNHTPKHTNTPLDFCKIAIEKMLKRKIVLNFFPPKVTRKHLKKMPLSIPTFSMN